MSSLRALLALLPEVYDTDPRAVPLLQLTYVPQIQVGSGPWSLAFTPDSAAAYVTNSVSATVTAIATSTRTATATWPLPPNSQPQGVGVYQQGPVRYVYVALKGTGAIARLNPFTGAVTQYPTGTGSQPWAIAVAADGVVYCTLMGTGKLARLDPATGALTLYAVGGTPQGCAVSPDGTTAYVACGSTNSLALVPLGGGAITQVPIPHGADHLAFDSARGAIYVVGEAQSWLTVLSPTGTIVTGTALTPGARPRGLAVATGGRAYIAQYTQGNVQVVDVTQAPPVLLHTVPTGVGPRMIRLTPDQTELWVANLGSDAVPGHTVSAFNAAGYASTPCWATIEDDTLTLAPVGSGQGPTRLALDYIDDATKVLLGIPGGTDTTHTPLSLGQLVTAVAALGQGYQAALLDGSYPYFTDQSALNPGLDSLWRAHPLLYLNQPLPPGYRQAQTTTTPATEGWYLNQPTGARPAAPRTRGTPLSSLGAALLAESTQDLSRLPILYGATNLLYTLLRPVARLLRTSTDWRTALAQQLDLRSADGIWLDRWGALYGADRRGEESDTQFRRRLAATTFRPRVSTSSIKRALAEGLGFTNVTITDTAAWQFQVDLVADLTLTNLLGAPVSAVVDRYRAAGTIWTQVAEVRPTAEQPQAPTDSIRARQLLLDGSTSIYSGTPVWYVTVVPPASAPSQGWGSGLFGGGLNTSGGTNVFGGT